jgi:hypothetical protein
VRPRPRLTALLIIITLVVPRLFAPFLPAQTAPPTPAELDQQSAMGLGRMGMELGRTPRLLQSRLLGRMVESLSPAAPVVSPATNRLGQPAWPNLDAAGKSDTESSQSEAASQP